MLTKVEEGILACASEGLEREREREVDGQWQVVSRKMVSRMRMRRP